MKIASHFFGELEIFNDNFFIIFELITHTQTQSLVHEHGLVVAPEQMSLLDEKPISDNKKSNKIYVSANTSSPMSQSSPTKRYDYSIVRHLDSTDI